MKKILSAILALTVWTTTLAQMPNFEPPAEVKSFGWMVGEWTGSAVFTMPDMPEMNLVMSFKAEFEGQFLKQTAVNDFGIFKMTETLFLGYDPMKSEYFGYSFSNLAPTPRIEHGNLEEGVLVMVSEPWGTMEQPAMTSRASVKKIDMNHCEMKLEFLVEDSWMTVTNVKFTRKK